MGPGSRSSPGDESGRSWGLRGKDSESWHWEQTHTGKEGEFSYSHIHSFLVIWCSHPARSSVPPLPQKNPWPRILTIMFHVHSFSSSTLPPPTGPGKVQKREEQQNHKLQVHRQRLDLAVPRKSSPTRAILIPSILGRKSI